MTATTDILRAQAFLPLESDIPTGVTITEYRGRRSRRRGRRLLAGRVLGIRRASR